MNNDPFYKAYEELKNIPAETLEKNIEACVYGSLDSWRHEHDLKNPTDFCFTKVICGSQYLDVCSLKTTAFRRTNVNKESTVSIEKLIEPFFKEADVVLVDLNIRRHGGHVAIEILADKPAGGITIEECARLNRKINDAIEIQNLIGENYTLSVSSPGLDRVLQTNHDFRRVLGREIRVFLLEPVQNRIEYNGVVSKVEDQNLTIDIGQEEILIPLQNISKGKQII